MDQLLADGRLRSACARHGVAVEEGDKGVVSIEAALALAGRLAAVRKFTREQAWTKVGRLLEISANRPHQLACLPSTGWTATTTVGDASELLRITLVTPPA